MIENFHSKIFISASGGFTVNEFTTEALEFCQLPSLFERNDGEDYLADKDDGKQ